MDAGKDTKMIAVFNTATDKINDALIYLQDETVKRMNYDIEAAERTAAELRAQLATVTAQLKDAETQRHYWFEAFNRTAGEMRILQEQHEEREYSPYVNYQFSRAAPPTWSPGEFDIETPLGQMLDGVGDEVEP